MIVADCLVLCTKRRLHEFPQPAFERLAYTLSEAAVVMAGRPLISVHSNCRAPILCL